MTSDSVSAYQAALYHATAFSYHGVGQLLAYGNVGSADALSNPSLKAFIRTGLLLRAVHVDRVDPLAFGYRRVAPPHRGVPFGRDRVVAAGLVGGVGEIGGEVAGIGAQLFGRPITSAAGIATSARRSIAAARGRTSSIPANSSAATTTPACAQVARCGRPRVGPCG